MPDVLLLCVMVSSWKTTESHRKPRVTRMKKMYLLVVIIMALVLTACGSTASPTAIPTVSLDNNASASSTQSSDTDSVSASAVIVPLQKAQLSFSGVGRVKSVDVKVGDQV